MIADFFARMGDLPTEWKLFWFGITCIALLLGYFSMLLLPAGERGEEVRAVEPAPSKLEPAAVAEPEKRRSPFAPGKPKAGAK